MRHRIHQPFLESDSGVMQGRRNKLSEMNLPSDLVLFLTAGKPLEYDPSSVEPGVVGLKSLDMVELGVVWVNADESPLRKDDPHAGDDGYYAVPAVSLTGTCEAYDPDFILLWLPGEQMFGTWDCDHWDLYVFPDKTWSDILSDPATYLNAQWGDYKRKQSEYFKPYPKYAFKEGMPF